MIRFDLHVHSAYSNDGELGIGEIVQKSINNNVAVLSITDHNSTRGIKEAVAICAKKEIEFIPGIEIDCTYQGIDLHLLGYHINWSSRDFEDLEKKVEMKIMDSIPLMIENLAAEGIQIDADEIMGKSQGKPPSPEFIAEVLLEKGESKTNNKLKPYLKGGKRSDMPYINFYLDFFAQGKPAHVKIEYMDFSDAIELVKRQGGIPIVAHPGLNLNGKEEKVVELLDQGAEGLEVFNNYHDRNQMAYFASLVKERDVLMTCGSDFHGKIKPVIEIGKYGFSDKYQETLEKSIASIHEIAGRII